MFSKEAFSCDKRIFFCSEFCFEVVGVRIFFGKGG